MSYPPPPGTAKSNLPPKPPTSIHAFASFKPRQVNSQHSAPHITSAAPSNFNYTAPGASQGYNSGYGFSVGAAQGYDAASSAYSQPATSSMSYGSYGSTQSQPSSHNQGERRPFVPRQTNSHSNNNHNNNSNNNNNSMYPPLDPELEAQIAEQQSIYDPAKRATATTGASASATTTSSNYDPASSYLPDGSYNSANATPTSSSKPSQPPGKKPTVLRSGGGETWKDDSLLEWDPAHFRLFVGNLAGEVTDESLLKAFAGYPSVQRARVIRDKRTTKSKGFGFVSFQDGDEFFKAAREMQGKYIGSHPVLLKKSTTEIRPVVAGKKSKNGGYNKNGKNNGNGGKNGVLGKKSDGGIKKKEKGPKLLG